MVYARLGQTSLENEQTVNKVKMLTKYSSKKFLTIYGGYYNPCQFMSILMATLSFINC